MSNAEGLNRSRSFWNEKAKEEPYWYVSSYGQYGQERNLEEFWASGLRIWSDLKGVSGYQPKPADRAVEIGCGVGRMTRAIATQVAQIDAFDISKNMVEIARTNEIQNATFHVTEGASLRPIPDGVADVVVAYCVFQHLPSLQALREYLEEMVRVARPGGTIIFTLSERNWRFYLLPVARFRSYLREKLSEKGPTGVYKKAWTGIRPSPGTVRSLCPIDLNFSTLHGDKWVFSGRR